MFKSVRFVHVVFYTYCIVLEISCVDCWYLRYNCTQNISYMLVRDPNHPTFCFFFPSRVFGHFEKPLFFELCKYIETKTVPANGLLFKKGMVILSTFS